MSTEKEEQTILEVDNLKKHFPVREGIFKQVTDWVKAVDGVSFKVKSGETLGLVGESGCGKSTLGFSLTRLTSITEGAAWFNSDLISTEKSGTKINIADLEEEKLRGLRNEMQMIFQDPFSSFDPRMTVGEVIREGLDIQQIGTKSERKAKMTELLEAVGLSGSLKDRYPHEFSGGQRQRIGVARALSLDPKFIICDEPVSALDVSVQAQVLNLLSNLQAEYNLTYLFITHDLSVIHYICDRVMVMYLGDLVEIAETKEIYKNPHHPYTEALLSAVPVADVNERSDRILLEGTVPSPINPPEGCKFHTRCPYSQDKCKTQVPEFKQTNSGHWVRCHFTDELNLTGIFDY